MRSDVKNRVALVIGAADEIGEAIVQQLASGGAQLALADAQRDKLDALAGGLGHAGLLTIVVDPTDPAAIADCVKQVLARYGKIDILVNNAGAPTGKALADLTASDAAAAVDAALLAPLHFMREVVPLMQRNGHGRVVNVNELAYLGLPRQANVAAACAGLFGVARSVALESARFGVTVNTVVKGDIAMSTTTDGEKDKVAAGIPVKRLGTPADVARAVGFLAGDAAKYLTGQTLFVCGGKSAYFSMSV